MSSFDLIGLDPSCERSILCVISTILIPNTRLQVSVRGWKQHSSELFAHLNLTIPYFPRHSHNSAQTSWKLSSWTNKLQSLLVHCVIFPYHFRLCKNWSLIKWLLLSQIYVPRTVRHLHRAGWKVKLSSLWKCTCYEFDFLNRAHSLSVPSTCGQAFSAKILFLSRPTCQL